MALIQDGDLIVIRHESQHYRTIFNRHTGFFVRKEDDSHPEPFWAEDGPELLDIAITNYCEHGCSFCYRKSNKSGKHVSLEDLQSVVKQANELGVLQIALGGGNPNQHPLFVEILKMIRESGIVPSYTSNGEGLTDDILQATKQYCGAMALSLYQPYDRYEGLTEKIKSFGIKLNLHVILKKDTIELLTSWLKEPPTWFSNINALIVLNYKPVASSSSLMVTDKRLLKDFYSAVSECQHTKIGFDSCCVPGIVTWMNVNPALIESCEAARFSAFISEELKMYPCSFMANTDSCGDLHQSSMLEIWQANGSFVEHRNKIKNNTCGGCKNHHLCNGGCAFMSEINQCRFNNGEDFL